MLKQKGFSTVSVVVGIVVVVILGFIFIPNIASPDKRNILQAQTDLQNLKSALNNYKKDNGFYPSDEQGLVALTQEPSIAPLPQNWNSYLKSLPKDPWGNPYQYENVDGYIKIWSFGPNGKSAETNNFILVTNNNKNTAAPAEHYAMGDS